MKYVLTFISLVLFSLNTFAQTPEKMSYQAVIRDNNNMPLLNSKVNLRIIIRQGKSSGSIAFEETHNVSTNSNGLVSLQIGEGSKKSGVFSIIDWSKGPYFIETQLDTKNSNDFSVTGVSEMIRFPTHFMRNRPIILLELVTNLLLINGIRMQMMIFRVALTI